MAVVVFGVIMTTLLMLLWIERKFFARIMDRRGATTALRSLWVGEGGEHADWYGLLPFGAGRPFKWLVGFLNRVAGSDHKVESVHRVRDRSYHGVWWMLPGMFQNLADAMKFLTKEWMVPSKSDKVVFEIAPFIIIGSVTTGIATLFLWKRLLYDPSHRGVINQLMIWFNSWPVTGRLLWNTPRIFPMYLV